MPDGGIVGARGFPVITSNAELRAWLPAAMGTEALAVVVEPFFASEFLFFP